MPRLVRRHLPVTTHRLRFDPIYPQLRTLPTITARMNFGGLSTTSSSTHQRRATSEASSILRQSLADTDEDSSAESLPHSQSTPGHVSDVDEDYGVTNEALIPKPPGEPGRPRSGGYNLQERLVGWTTVFFDEVKVDT